MDAANETAGVYSKMVGDEPVIMNEGAHIAVEDAPTCSDINNNGSPNDPSSSAYPSRQSPLLFPKTTLK